MHSGCHANSGVLRTSKTHIRAARNNGCTKAEIREVLLQCAVYAGVPVMRDAVRVAQAVFAEEGKKAKR